MRGTLVCVTTPATPPPSRDTPRAVPPHPTPPDTVPSHPAPPDADARRSALRAGLRLGAVILGLVTVVALLGLLVRGSAAVASLDLALSDGANRTLTGPAARIALGIDLVFGPRVAVALAVAAALAAGLVRRSLLIGARLAVMIAVPWGFVAVVKLVVRRPRPDGDLLLHQLLAEPTSFSYPSGHTAFATALCLAILCALPAATTRFRIGLGIALAALVVLATAWSRVAVGMHYSTDVLASMLLIPPLSLLLARIITRTVPDHGFRDRIVA